MKCAFPSPQRLRTLLLYSAVVLGQFFRDHPCLDVSVKSKLVGITGADLWRLQAFYSLFTRRTLNSVLVCSASISRHKRVTSISYQQEHCCGLALDLISVYWETSTVVVPAECRIFPPWIFSLPPRPHLSCKRWNEPSTWKAFDAATTTTARTLLRMWASRGFVGLRRNESALNGGSQPAFHIDHLLPVARIATGVVRGTGEIVLPRIWNCVKFLYFPPRTPLGELTAALQASGVPRMFMPSAAKTTCWLHYEDNSRLQCTVAHTTTFFVTCPTL